MAFYDVYICVLMYIWEILVEFKYYEIKYSISIGRKLHTYIYNLVYYTHTHIYITFWYLKARRYVLYISWVVENQHSFKEWNFKDRKKMFKKIKHNL